MADGVRGRDVGGWGVRSRGESGPSESEQTGDLQLGSWVAVERAKDRGVQETRVNVGVVVLVLVLPRYVGSVKKSLYRSIGARQHLPRRV